VAEDRKPPNLFVPQHPLEGYRSSPLLRDFLEQQRRLAASGQYRRISEALRRFRDSPIGAEMGALLQRLQARQQQLDPPEPATKPGKKSRGKKRNSARAKIASGKFGTKRVSIKELARRINGGKEKGDEGWVSPRTVRRAANR